MFKGLRDALQMHKELWDYSGYWADVVVEYGKLTGWDIGESAKRAGGEKLLDQFCRTAQAQGLSPRECAQVLDAEGYHDPSVLMQRVDVPDVPDEKAETEADDVEAEDETVPRNAPCPCGSGKRFKHCHGRFEPVIEQLGAKGEEEEGSEEEESEQGDPRDDTESKSAAHALQQALANYIDAVVELTDKKFAETWPFDPDWVGLLSVATDLDKARGNTKKVDEITTMVREAFIDGQTVEQCAAFMVAKHMSNQRELESMTHSTVTISKKEPATAMDVVIRAVYGDHPPAKSADLERAITIAHEDLLSEQVSASEVEQLARASFAGPIPYSTHDLAVSTALGFFKRPEFQGKLWESQMAARLRVLNWLKAGKVVPPLAQSFENVLYRIYKTE